MRFSEWSIIIISETGSESDMKIRLTTVRIIAAVLLILLPLTGLVRITHRIATHFGTPLIIAVKKNEHARLSTETALLEHYTEQLARALFYNSRKTEHVEVIETKRKLSRAGIGILPLLRMSYQLPQLLFNRTAVNGESIPDPVFPYRTPVQGIITSRFGVRSDPVYEGTAFHEGIDIANTPSTPVCATADGAVLYSGWKQRFGQTVILLHTDEEYQSVYAHLRKIIVHEGEQIKAGTVIGYLGSTGKSTGPHLHFEVRRKGKPIDPLSFLLTPDVVVD
jgi:murein DD-endopeptidase MepM/ murein hydrolase activator NlpD